MELLWGGAGKGWLKGGGQTAEADWTGSTGCLIYSTAWPPFISSPWTSLVNFQWAFSGPQRSVNISKKLFFCLKLQRVSAVFMVADQVDQEPCSENRIQHWPFAFASLCFWVQHFLLIKETMIWCKKSFLLWTEFLTSIIETTRV